MKIDYIKITNFRPYYGTQTINFSKHPTKNITLIQGNNGSGKTSLLNAFTWCLYGEELHDDHSQKEQDLYNRIAANELEEDRLNVSVEINFLDIDSGGNEIPLNVKRDQNFWIDPNGELVPSDYGSELTITQLIGDDHVISTRSNLIEQKIPKEMHNYFFFNGATLNGYFKKNNKKNLKNSVEEISQLPLINTVQNHVQNLREYYRKEITKKSSNTSLEHIENEINKINNNKEETKKGLKIAEKEKEIAEENISTLKDKLIQNEHSNVKDLAKTQEILDDDVKTIKERLKKARKEHENYILKIYPLVKMFNIFEKSILIYEKGREKGQVPPLYRKSFLKDLIENKRCICGVDLENNPENMDKLKKALENTSDITDRDISQPINNIKTIFHDLKKCEETISKQLKVIYDEEKQLKIKKDDLDQTKEKMKSLDIDEINELTEELDFNENLARKQKNLINDLNYDLEKFEKELEYLNREHTKISRLNQTLSKLSEKKSFCEKAKPFIENLESIMRKDIHRIVETKTREQFTNIEWANEKFEDIEIDEFYNIHIITKAENGTRTREEPIPFLSGGERIVLALSFMLSLHKITGFNLPIVIDAPFEQLDTDKRHDIVKQLPETTKNKQITLLVTNTQYTDSVQGALSEYIGKEYELIDKGLKTEVIEHDRN